MDRALMNTQWTIRPYQEEDEEAVLRLRRICFPKGDPESQRKHQGWLWRNPYGCYGWVAVADGEVIGFEGRLLAPMRVLHRQTLASIGFDLMVAPPHRRKGIGRGLVWASRREIQRYGVEVSLGYTDARSSLVSDAAEGLLLGHLSDFYHPTTALGRLGLHVWSIRYPLLNVDHAPLRRRKATEIEVRPFTPTTTDFQHLASLDPAPDDIRILRTHSWLNWRYRERPGARECFLMMRSRKETVGYVTYSVRSYRGLRIGEIEDLQLPHGVGGETAENVFLEVLSSVDSVDLWRSKMFPDSRYGRLLSAAGFFYSPDFGSFVTMTVPSGCEDGESLVDDSRWYLSPADVF